MKDRWCFAVQLEPFRDEDGGVLMPQQIQMLVIKELAGL